MCSSCELCFVLYYRMIMWHHNNNIIIVLSCNTMSNQASKSMCITVTNNTPSCKLNGLLIVWPKLRLLLYYNSTPAKNVPTNFPRPTLYIYSHTCS